MTKFKIEKGISRVARAKLQAAIEESVARDIALLCEWSNNDKNYVVNQLLRFALSQDGEFQSYKQSLPERSNTITPLRTAGSSTSQTPTIEDRVLPESRIAPEKRKGQLG